jgi:hypothetical protein
MTNSELTQKWLQEARRHEACVEELHEREGDDEERLLHIEIARTLRNCIRDLGVAA